MIGMKATYKFYVEVVRSLEEHPDATEASNGYALATEEEEVNHSYMSTINAGNDMPELKSTGTYAAFVLSIKVHQSSSALFI